MAYTSWSVVFGEQPSAAKWNILGTNDAYFDSLIGSGTAWGAYTPAWTSSGTAPAIGNGTLTGAYQQFGKSVRFRMYFKAGTTTTFGTGNYFWSLPVAGNSFYATAGGNQSFNGGGYAEDNGVKGYISIAAQTNSTTTASKFSIMFHSIASAGESGGVFGQTTPFTWANTDYFNFSGFYEAA